MYFGSVKFFKHLIVVLTIAAIGVLGYFTVSSLIENNRLNDELKLANDEKTSLSSLIDYYSGSKTVSVQEICRIAKDTGISEEELLKYLYEKDPAAFAKVFSEWNKSEIPDTTDDIDTETAPPPQTQDAVADVTTQSPVQIQYANDANTIYLTFDDGPLQYTEELLEILDRANIKATFFLSPKDTPESFDLMNKIVEAGHAIGVHTVSHNYEEIYASVDSYVDDFTKAHELIKRATGIDCKLFRFPGGSKNSYNPDIIPAIIEEMTARGYVYFDWNVDSGDSIGANWTAMYTNVISNVAAQSRSVVLFHDGIYNTTLVLEDIINALSVDAKGYKFEPITESVKPLQF